MSIVTDDMVKVALNACRVGADALAPGWMQRALAAVAPAFAAQEREACIAAAREALENYRAWDRAITPHTLMKPIEAAIRARGEAGDA